MATYFLCYSDASVTYEGDNKPFWDILTTFRPEDGPEWVTGIIGTTELDEARMLLGIPPCAELHEDDEYAPWPYTQTWTFEADKQAFTKRSA